MYIYIYYIVYLHLIHIQIFPDEAGSTSFPSPTDTAVKRR